jgi:hypothetical protein
MVYGDRPPLPDGERWSYRPALFLGDFMHAEQSVKRLQIDLSARASALYKTDGVSIAILARRA